MQPASASFGKETTGVSDEDAEGEGKCEKDVVVQESRKENEKLKKIMLSPDQVDAVSGEVQRGATDTGSSSSE